MTQQTQQGGKCPSCDTENSYSATFCSFCGTRLPWADALANKTVEQERLASRINETTDKTIAASKEAFKQMTTVTPEDEEMAKKAGTFIGTCIGYVIAAVAILCVIGWIISMVSPSK